MIALKLLLVLCSIHPLVNGMNFWEYTYGLKEPEPTGLRDNVTEGWFTQVLDHFNYRDNRTWSMRYFENSVFLKKNSPILIFTGGEWNISAKFVKSGLMYDLASTYGGMMYYTEHRYYGKSRPTKNISLENLQYLNAEQALADLAYFIKAKKEQMHLEQSPVILFGCSYGGNIAAWARLKYPHLVQGAIASAAAVYAKADFYEFYEAASTSLSRHSKECVADMGAAITLFEDTLKVEDGPEELTELFNFCGVPNVSSAEDISYFKAVVLSVIVQNVVYDTVGPSQKRIDVMCSTMTSPKFGNLLQRLAYIFRLSNPDNCVGTSYRNYIKLLRNVKWRSTKKESRQWYHQLCMEAFGYFGTVNSDNSTFGRLVPLQYYIKLCRDVYDQYYNETFLNSRISRTNLMYGGRRPDVRKVIFTNGDIDPWHTLSVLEDINDSSPAILINGSSHCNELYEEDPDDIENLKKARARIRAIIGEWLST